MSKLFALLIMLERSTQLFW